MEIALLAWGAAAGPASSPVATTCRSSSCTRTGEPEAAARHPAPQLPGGPGRLGRAARRDGADQPTAARSERPLAGPGSLCRPPCRSDVACTGFSWLGGGCTAEDVEHDSCVSANIRSPGYPTHTSKRFAPVGRSVHHRAPAVNPCHSCLVRGSPRRASQPFTTVCGRGRRRSGLRRFRCLPVAAAMQPKPRSRSRRVSPWSSAVARNHQVHRARAAVLPFAGQQLLDPPGAIVGPVVHGHPAEEQAHVLDAACPVLGRARTAEELRPGHRAGRDEFRASTPRALLTASQRGTRGTGCRDARLRP